ncbi:MAG: hypothetical protein EOP06_16495 [Proteobacteria bacterium]|nr:MAG: hypothetical protein EOP06_16495 [Pseudomonadota bacterium]
MKTLIPLVMIAISSFAHPAKAGIRENGGFLVPSAAELNFTSPGNGIDNGLKNAVEALVESYHSAGLVHSYKKNGYGREGETKICVQLNEIEASRRLNRELKELVDRSERKTNLQFISSCEKEPINGRFEMKSQVDLNESSFSFLARYTLIQVFSKAGKIAKLDYLFHKTGPLRGKPRGYAFVEYTNKEVGRALIFDLSAADSHLLF